MENSVNNANQFYFAYNDSEETLAMYTKSRNIETMKGDERDEIIQELSESLLQNYQSKFRRTNDRKQVCSW